MNRLDVANGAPWSSDEPELIRISVEAAAVVANSSSSVAARTGSIMISMMRTTLIVATCSSTSSRNVCQAAKSDRPAIGEEE